MPILPLAPVVGIFALPTTVTLYTITKTIDEKGFADKSEDSASISAVIHPASGRDVQRVEPGRRTTASIWVYTTAVVNVGQEIGYQRPGDSASKRWLVISAESWQTQSGHYRALAVAP